MDKRWGKIGGCAVALVLTLGACGGGGGKKAASTSSTGGSSTASSAGASTGGGDKASVDACKLSESDIESIVGFKVEKQDGSGSSSCTYAAPSTDSDHLGASVSFNLSTFAGGQAAIETAKKALSDTFKATAEDVDGVGDSAFLIDAGVVTELIVFDGTTQVTLAIGGLNDDPNRKQELVALAKKLLA